MHLDLRIQGFISYIKIMASKLYESGKIIKNRYVRSLGSDLSVHYCWVPKPTIVIC